jgi:hypothetical protein
VHGTKASLRSHLLETIHIQIYFYSPAHVHAKLSSICLNVIREHRGAGGISSEQKVQLWKITERATLSLRALSLITIPALPTAMFDGFSISFSLITQVSRQHREIPGRKISKPLEKARFSQPR